MTEDGHIVVDLSGARALFTTRHGGVSPAPYDSLNFGFLTDDDNANVAANRDRVERAHDVRLAFGRQVHGNHVREADTHDTWGEPLAEADGIVTTTEGVAPMVLAADCLPIVIAAPGAVAAVHAGWHGLETDVIAAGVEAVRRLSPYIAPELTAVIGPGAGPCCYEVGEDLHERFAARGEDLRRGRNLDLKAIAARQLRAAGVAKVEDVELCTICDEHRRFFSHRREAGLTGRQAGIAWLS